MASIDRCLNLLTDINPDDYQALRSVMDQLVAQGVPYEQAAQTAAQERLGQLEQARLDLEQQAQGVMERGGLPETIEVDGVQRPTTNSEGKPIHPTERGVRNFWRWFAGSKVVDAEGRPLVVYHGTNAVVDNDFAFKESRHGQAGRGIYMTPFNGEAAQYGKNLIEAYSAVTNPYEVTRKDIPMDNRSWREAIENLGYDGVLIRDAFGGLDELTAFNPNQIKSAIGNTGAFSPTDERILYQGGYANQDAETQALIDKALEQNDNADNTRELLDRYKDTPWAKQAVEGAKVRAALQELLAGNDPQFDNLFNSPRSAKIKNAILNHGADAIWKYFQANGMLSHPSKPIHSVNSSFLDCEPSKACAQYCYAALGRNYASIVIRAELTDWAIHQDPVRFAKQVAAEYKTTAEFMAGKALRLFERGDGSQPWIEFIKTLNEEGVRAHVFSKRPEFLRQVPEMNVRLLSTDSTNQELAEANPDLPVAYVYQNEAEAEWLQQHKDAGGNVQLVLPVINKGKHLTKEQQAAIPKWARPLTCPVDKGGLKIGTGKGEWNCTRCDAGGGVGCYHKNTSEKVMQVATVPLSSIVKRDDLSQTLKEIEDVARRLDPAGQATLRQELANLLSQARAGIDPETKGDAARGVREGIAEEGPGGQGTGRDGQGLTLNQPGDTPRGRIAFPAGGVGAGPTTISITPDSDPSTLIHEGAHFWLETWKWDIQRGAAVESEIADMQILLDWWGIDSIDQIGVEQHELFARSWEVYMREGKAPVPELQSIFEQFAAWLMQVYKTLRGNYDIQLSDEVRGVFDRMLASQEAIDAARRNSSSLDADLLGLTPEEFADLMRANEQAQAVGRSRVLRESLNDEARRATKAYHERRRQITKEVEAEVARDWDVRVKQLIMTGKAPLEDGDAEDFRLSRDGLRMLGIDPQGLPMQLLSDKNHPGRDPRVVAELFGFGSVQEMLDKLTSTPTFNQAVKAEVQARMDQEYPNGLDNVQQIAQRAIDAMHTDAAAKYIGGELKALARRAGTPATPTQVLREVARRIIGESRVVDITPHRYLQQEKRWGRVALEMALAGDFKAAADAKTKELLNHLLYQQGRQARENAEKWDRYFRSFDKPAKRKRLARDYLDQIDAILETTQFGSASNKAVNRAEAFKAWYANQVALGNEPIFGEDVLQRLAQTHYKAKSYAELKEMADDVKNIEHLGKLKQQLLDKRNQRLFDEAVDEMATQAENSGLWQNTVENDLRESFAQRGLKLWARFKAEHLKPEFITTELDGLKHGVWWETLFRPFADAEDADSRMRKEAVEALDALLQQLDRKTLDHEVVLGDLKLSREQLLAVALNWGNTYNREAFLTSEGLSEQQVIAVFEQHLTAQDWQVVQGIWDLIDSYWPQIAELQKDLTGVVPEKVERSPFTIGGVQLAGGYYPLVGDTQRDSKAIVHDAAQKVQEMERNYSAKASTRKGHTINRTNWNGKKIRLDLGVTAEHLVNVIHDLTHRRAVIQANRLLGDKRVETALVHTFGRDTHTLLKEWVKGIASDAYVMDGVLERVVGHLRRGATAVNMGMKVTTAIVQPLGYTQSIDLLGAKWAWKGLVEFYASPFDNAREIMAKSEAMATRAQNLDRDVRDAIRRLKGNGPVAWIQRHLYDHIGFLDMTVSMPTWMGAYQKGIADGMDDADAVSYADSIVRMSQSAGGAKDLAAIQRGSEYKRAFTMFYSYFSVLYNLLRRGKQATKSKGLTLAAAMEGSKHFLLLVVLPSVLAEAIVGRWPEDDDEDETAWWLAKTIGFYPAMSMVGVRDLANAVSSDYGYSASPAYDFGETFAVGAKGVWDAFDPDEEMSEWEAKNLFLAGGYLTHMPARQAWTTGEHLWSVLNGEEEFSLYELLYRSKPD